MTQMNPRSIASAAIASLMALGAAGNAAAADNAGKEKCFGIAKAGQNDCANLSGSHSCAGQAKADNDAGEWKFVKAGSCNAMGGKTLEQAKMAK
jgi:uncharacterized membrane protein